MVTDSARRDWPAGLDEWALVLKNLFLPIFCKECRAWLLTEENGFFCPVCWETSPRITRPFCTCCGRPHTQTVGFGTASNFPCAQCRAKPPRHVRRIYGAACYDGAVAEAIKLFKFHDRPRLAKPLGELMAGFAGAEMDCAAYDFVVPVPLHRVRERDRGYNQSRLLAEALTQTFPRTRLNDSLKRIRPTQVQSQAANPAARRANVVGAFAVLGESLFEGSTVLLIDDVVTTAGTVSECAAALKRAGAAQVDVLAAALAVWLERP